MRRLILISLLSGCVTRSDDPVPSIFFGVDAVAGVFPEDFHVTLARLNGCLMGCADYRATVYEDRLLYFGRENVDVAGTRTQALDRSVLAQVVTELLAVDFDHLEPYYTDGSDCVASYTDLASAKVAVHNSGLSKAVRFDYGCESARQQDLIAASERIDELAGTLAFTGTYDGLELADTGR